MKKLFLSLIILLVLGITFSCKKEKVFEPDFYACNLPFNDSSTSNMNNEKYQNLINGIAADGVPGVMMSIASPQEGMWLGTAGKADLAANVDLQSCNITRVGSTVKTFTATTILMLNEEGLLKLDDPASKYLSASDIKDIENADMATIRQLLQHSSGIFNYIQNLQFQTASLNDLIKEWSPDELLSYARKKPAYFAPGTDVYYSNTNYVLLGMIITNITGKPFYEVFKEKIFEPLNLTFTSFAATDPVPLGTIRGYVDFYSNLDVINATYYSGWDYFTADGGLISNPYDESVFFTALLSGQIISQASLEEMLTFKAPNDPDPDFFPIYYGLGIFKIETPYGIAYMHSGDAIGYYAIMVYFPEQQTTICWAVNGNYGKIDEFTSSETAMDNIFSTVFN